MFGLILLINNFSRNFKNRPIWSHWMWYSKKTSWDGSANNKKTFQVSERHKDKSLKGHLEQDVDVRLLIRDVHVLFDQSELLVVTCCACGTDGQIIFSTFGHFQVKNMPKSTKYLPNSKITLHKLHLIIIVLPKWWIFVNSGHTSSE